ncbi:MAG: T9SS type A sorting domain-containing protein, partial [Flavobacteriales bacterium]|nr:T9SS type A sorting domain-containing protein [Flavobacteriales bacterium]
CACVGTVVWDCPDLEANIGDACDDGDAATINDVITDECICAGEIGGGISEGDGHQVVVNLYPNPSRNGSVMLDVEGLGTGSGTAVITVHATSGQRILRTSVAVVNGAVHHRLEFGSLTAQGLYLVELVAGNRHFTAHLVVQ